jgi:MFS superfamily sulfate permease-like transporter
MLRVSRLDFLAAAVALVGVLLLGILQGTQLAALASILLLLAWVSRPHIAFLGRVPGTNSYSDLDRHPENEPLSGVIAFRPEASLIYVNADIVLDSVLDRLRAADPAAVRLEVCDLSAAPYIDLAGSRCCTSFTPSLPVAALRCASLVLMDRRAICCLPRVSRRRLERSTVLRHSTVCLRATIETSCGASVTRSNLPVVAREVARC